MAAVPEGALVLFPIQPTMAPCGLAGIVAFKKPQDAAVPENLATLAAMLDTCAANGLESSRSAKRPKSEVYLGGTAHVRALKSAADGLKEKGAFFAVFSRPENRRQLKGLEERLQHLIVKNAGCF